MNRKKIIRVFGHEVSLYYREENAAALIFKGEFYRYRLAHKMHFYNELYVNFHKAYYVL